MRVAVIGAGIAGLAAAHTLREHAAVALFESAPTFGGHAHTVDITLPGRNGEPVTHGVDTGFLVYNERTYPELIRLLAALGVETAKADMSFSVQVPQAGAGGGPLEWSGSSLGTVFAQRANLRRPQFWGMLRDLLRFNALASRLARTGTDAALAQPLGEFLRAQHFGDAFRNWYLLPMLGCIWSCPTDQMLRFPVATLIRFCHNHGLLQVTGRPQWHTVAGGSRRYVDRIVEGLADCRAATPVLRVSRRADRDGGGVEVVSARGSERFDRVVIATHTDQALALLPDASTAERALLGAIRYQANRAVLHTDTGVLPQARAAWAAWNYERAPTGRRESSRVCLHYLLNRLQPLPWSQPVIVSLNPLREVDRNCVMGTFDYAHPVFDNDAIRAQRELPALQGRGGVYFCGAWAGYGFHEDGLKSGLEAARRLLQDGASALGANRGANAAGVEAPVAATAGATEVATA